MAVAAAMAAGYHRSGGHMGMGNWWGMLAEWRLRHSVFHRAVFAFGRQRMHPEFATSKVVILPALSSHATLTSTDEWFWRRFNVAYCPESRSGFSVSPSQVVTVWSACWRPWRSMTRPKAQGVAGLTDLFGAIAIQRTGSQKLLLLPPTSRCIKLSSL